MAESQNSRSGHSMRTTDRHLERYHRRDHEHRPKHKHRTHSPRGSKELSSNSIELKLRSEPMGNDYFVSDKKGDPDIIRYGSNNSYRVPKYRRIGSGLVLGLSRAFKIDREHTTEKGIVLIDSSSTRTRNKAAFGKLAKIEEYRIYSTPEDPEDLHKNYLSLRSRKSRRNSGSEGTSDESTDDDSIQYRSIKGKARDSDFIDRDLELDRSETNIGDSIKSDVQLKLERLVEVEPANGRAWLDLIEQSFKTNAKRETYAERISTADIKIAMYEKALKNVIGPARESLLRGLMKEASLAWDHNKVQRKWQDILQANGHSFGLWKGFLNYIQANTTRFKFDDIKEHYQKCIKIFKGGMNTFQYQSSEQDRANTAANLIYFLLRFTICLRQAGYVEQAIATWQANLEYHLYSHTSKSHTKEQQFESFWDSEVARIGEPNALGVQHYQEHGGDAPVEVEDPSKPNHATIRISDWFAYEAQMSNLLPARTMDIADEEDAFRVVLYSDIQPYLFDIPAESHEELMDGFLLFCGLPPAYQQASRHWTNDPFIHQSFLLKNMERNLDNGMQTSKQKFKPGSSCVITTEVLFGGMEPFSLATQDSERENGVLVLPAIDDLPVRLEWIRNVLKSLVAKDQGTHQFKLTEYYLALELHYYPQQVKKTSKNILKLHSKHLPLYNVHAMIEYRMGNHAAAEKVLQTAMKMRPEDSNVILLQHTLVWGLLENNQASAALKQLTGDSNDEASIFQAQRRLLVSRDAAVSNSSCEHLLPTYVDCLVLLSYLNNPNPLEAALAIFESNITSIAARKKSGDKTLEIIHQNLARLLHYHMEHHHYKPQIIRKALQRSIAAFPRNTIFLSLFQLNEQRYRINDRVRQVVSDVLFNKEQGPTVENSSPLIGYLFGIDAEVNRSVNLGSSKESIRSEFERALSDADMKSSPAIWSLYIKFELSICAASGVGKSDARKRATNVIARSMVACPWVLDYYLLAINMISEALVENRGECRGYYDAIVDRELRVHMLLKEEFWK